ncbi:hypothetical protein [Methylogaea oryzae]|uniref:Uncharacterized protein n=1 Tax=Methylogaea oryzae TaxID=1295382 RepID=A0A8D4VNY9_9GAMM|nr:hypothetical protein [Methylogaea oryzae]BBL71388.1 hypothetical protein MoryE10_19940 [Methylogaea oryzae]
MDDFDLHQDEAWDAGFVAGSQAVVARIGPYRKLFLRPQHFRQRFFHRVYDLPIEDWRVTPLARELGGVCQVQVNLTVRFQPTLAYVSAHPECLADVSRFIRTQFEPVLVDEAELMMRELESGEWMLDGCGPWERRLEDAVQVALAVHHVRCRCHCRIDAGFDSATSVDHLTPAGLRLREHYLVLQRRQEDEAARRLRQRLDHEEEARRLQLEHQEKLLELARANRELERRAEQQAAEELREKLEVEEARLRETMDSEARRQKEQLRYEHEVKKLKLAVEQEELQQRQSTLEDKDECVKRELELLFMEKQRLMLQAEIRDLQETGRELSR